MVQHHDGAKFAVLLRAEPFGELEMSRVEIAQRIVRKETVRPQPGAYVVGLAQRNDLHRYSPLNPPFPNCVR